MADAMVRVLRDDEAMVNVTYGGSNGDLPDPVYWQSTEADIKAMVTEAVRNGGVPGIAANRDANFTDFQVDRYPPTEQRPHNLIQIRPKTVFGMAPGGYRANAEYSDITQPAKTVKCCPNCGRAYE